MEAETIANLIMVSVTATKVIVFFTSMIFVVALLIVLEFLTRP